MNKITSSVLNTAISFMRDGKVNRAKAFGFTDEELRRLRRLSASELDELAADNQAICQHTIIHEMLDAKLRRLDQSMDRDTLIDRCLQLGASVAMMAKFFGLTPNDCSTRRLMLDLETRPGRQALPDEDDEHDAYRRWQSISLAPQDPLQAPEDLKGMMVLAEETGITLTALWSLIKTWVNADPAKDPDDEAPQKNKNNILRGRACPE